MAGNGGGTSNLPGDFRILTNRVWSSASSSAHMACPCLSTLVIKSLIMNGVLEHDNPVRLHCCRMYANISPVSRSTRKNCVPKYDSNRCNVITSALLDLLLASDHLISFCPLFLPQFSSYHLEVSIPMATLGVLLRFSHW